METYADMLQAVSSFQEVKGAFVIFSMTGFISIINTMNEHTLFISYKLSVWQRQRIHKQTASQETLCL